MNKNNVVILIPSFNPSYKLISYIDELINRGITDIIIVNDGSKKECIYIFDKLEKKSQCKVLNHAINQGKGRALKTGFNYFITTYKNKVGVITTDSDGQHNVDDVIRIAKELKNNNCNVILGTRDFNTNTIPLKSKFGNKITSLIYAVLYNKKITDTQTGLRGIPVDVIKKIITLEGEKFEYEINMLIYISRNKINIKEITIDTIYTNKNIESHFKPIMDSLKIYSVIFKMFIKFSFSGIVSALLDITIFTILVKFIIYGSIQDKIFYGTIIARIISSVLNYFLNKNLVFESNSNKREYKYLLKYYTLCLLQMLVSWLLVITIYKVIKLDEVITKELVDLFLFVVSYQIQSRWIFNKITKS